MMELLAMSLLRARGMRNEDGINWGILDLPKLKFAEPVILFLEEIAFEMTTPVYVSVEERGGTITEQIQI